MTDQFHPGKCLPDCMMPGGGECCPGYVALYDAYWHLMRRVPAHQPPMLADIAQIIDAGWKAGKSSAEVAGEILREFDAPAQRARDLDLERLIDCLDRYDTSDARGLCREAAAALRALSSLTSTHRCPTCRHTDDEYAAGDLTCVDPWHGDDHLRAKASTECGDAT